MAAVFSAYGIGACDISQRYAVTLEEYTTACLNEVLDALEVKASRDMFAEGCGAGSYTAEAKLVADLGDGEESVQPLDKSPVFPTAFAEARSVEVEFKAVKALRTNASRTASFVKANPASSDGMRNILTRGRGRIDVPVYRVAQLNAGDWATGPAILEEDYFTCRVLDGWTFTISDAGDILLNGKG